MRHIIMGRAFRRADFSVYQLELWASSSVDPAPVCEFPGKLESSSNCRPALRRARCLRETAGQESSAGRKAFFLSRRQGKFIFGKSGDDGDRYAWERRRGSLVAFEKPTFRGVTGVGQCICHWHFPMHQLWSIWPRAIPGLKNETWGTRFPAGIAFLRCGQAAALPRVRLTDRGVRTAHRKGMTFGLM